jgi:hypothetical protein
VKTYIEGGGLAIVGLHFPKFITLSGMNEFFKAFDLPWKRGDYHRTSFQFVPSSTFPASLNLASVPTPWSMKVLHIANARTQKKSLFLVLVLWYRVMLSNRTLWMSHKLLLRGRGSDGVIWSIVGMLMGRLNLLR